MAALLDGVSTPLVVLLITCLIVGSITYRIMRIRWLLKDNAGMYDPLMYPMAYGDGRPQQQPQQQPRQQPQQPEKIITGGRSSWFFESASLPEERLF